jgi:hypothetical protein
MSKYIFNKRDPNLINENRNNLETTNTDIHPEFFANSEKLVEPNKRTYFNSRDDDDDDYPDIDENVDKYKKHVRHTDNNDDNNVNDDDKYNGGLIIVIFKYGPFEFLHI